MGSLAEIKVHACFEMSNSGSSGGDDLTFSLQLHKINRLIQPLAKYLPGIKGKLCNYSIFPDLE